MGVADGKGGTDALDEHEELHRDHRRVEELLDAANEDAEVGETNSEVSTTADPPTDAGAKAKDNDDKTGNGADDADDYILTAEEA